MAAGLFGALGAIGDLGNQAAEGRQLAHEEIVRRLAEQQARQSTTLNQQRTRQLIEKGQQDMQLAQQPIALGSPYVSEGKTYQRYQHPLTSEISVKELPGGLSETPEQELFRGLMGLPGMTEETASQAVVKQLTGKTTLKREVQPDASSPTGFSAVYLDSGDGSVLWSAPTLPPRTAVPRQTDRDTTDPVTGLTTHSRTITKPLMGGGAGQRPQTTAGAIRGMVGLPNGSASQGGPATPPSSTVPRGASIAKTTPKQGSGPAAPAAISIGPYKGIQLTEDGRAIIPARPGITESVRQAAQDILDGRDTSKIPAKVRFLGESVAKAYGWKGQGSLTPAQQMQIQQVDNSLATLSDPKFLKLFDSTLGRLRMSTVPLDPTGEGGFAGLSAALNRGSISQDQAEYMNALTRLRGVIGGIRGFTGANNSNATADRLLAELPNFTNTKNSTDAANKIARLRQEVAIIKRLGYFLPSESAPGGGGAAAPAADNPLGLDLAPAGR
jgi:hypothetical protein